MVSKNNRIGSVQILLGASLFGLIPIFVRLGKNISTLDLVFFRAFFGALFVLILIKAKNRKLSPIRDSFIKLFFWSIILLVAIFSYFYSLKLIDIASATLLLNLNSVFVILFSKFLLKERINRTTILSLCLSIVGMFFIVNFSDIAHVGSFAGYIAAINAALWTGLNFVYPKKYLMSMDNLSLTFYQTLFQIPVLLPFLVFYPTQICLHNILIFCCLGLLCTALAFSLIYSGVPKVKSQFVGILQTSESIVPIFIAWIFWGEVPGVSKIFGGILLITAYIIITLNQGRKHT